MSILPLLVLKLVAQETVAQSMRRHTAPVCAGSPGCAGHFLWETKVCRGPYGIYLQMWLPCDTHAKRDSKGGCVVYLWYRHTLQCKHHCIILDSEKSVAHVVLLLISTPRSSLCCWSCAWHKLSYVWSAEVIAANLSVSGECETRGMSVDYVQ